MIKALQGAAIAVLLAPALATAGQTAKVTNGQNDGAGSLRAALESGAQKVLIHPGVRTILVTETLVYDGTKPLTLQGAGQTIDGSSLADNAAPIFEVSNGADLTIHNLTFDAGGEINGMPYSRLNQGGGKGIFVSVPPSRTGTVDVRLWNVTVLGTGNHGIHVSDCSLGDACGAGAGGGGDGSPASLNVQAYGVLVENSGNGKQDADGIRVDDRGPGGIVFLAVNSVFQGVGADGVELDEGNDGDVFASVTNTTFYSNGEYCNIGDEPAEGDPCNDDGDRDVDDAFDIDEDGPGSLVAYVRNVDVIENFDEGLDFDEAGTGGTHVVVVNLYSFGNEDEGIKVSEEDAGSNVAWLRAVTTDGDLEFEEADDGLVRVSVYGSTVGDEMQLAADDEDPSTIDGYYTERGSSVAELDFEGDIEIR